MCVTCWVLSFCILCVRGAVGQVEGTLLGAAIGFRGRAVGTAVSMKVTDRRACVFELACCVCAGCVDGRMTTARIGNDAQIGASCIVVVSLAGRQCRRV